MSDNSPTQPAPLQLRLDLGVRVEREVGGIEMGVLDNGISYLTQAGLASVAGAARSTIWEITQEWEAAQQSGIFKGRISYFQEALSRVGYDDPKLYIEIERGGSPLYAYPDLVCTTIIEYFAFEAKRTNDIAITSFREFARYGLQNYIYRALDYKPADKWRMHNERVSLLNDSVPVGFFSIFKEVSGMIVDLINADLPIDDHTIPDISVGLTWGKFWTAHEFSGQFGDRVQYAHYYPSSFPQSASNPQNAWAYPNASWPQFQAWFHGIYLPTKYPPYILKKAKLLPGGRAEAARLAAIYEPKQIN
ncbi:hypothetical protein HW509_10610 [Asaia spathodeae]|uniref:hypothetical protein n=1 Tax=Asaia spathodeae TaxID=657016 RepID=UPI002FC32363